MKTWIVILLVALAALTVIAGVFVFFYMKSCNNKKCISGSCNLLTGCKCRTMCKDCDDLGNCTSCDNNYYLDNKECYINKTCPGCKSECDVQTGLCGGGCDTGYYKDHGDCIADETCPKNCSKHGKCQKKTGKCHCGHMYYGDDCSINIAEEGIEWIKNEVTTLCPGITPEKTIEVATEIAADIASEDIDDLPSAIVQLCTQKAQ